MHEYCMSRDDLDTLLGVTSFKTKGAWNEDPMKGVPTALKSAFTRCAAPPPRPCPTSSCLHATACFHLPDRETTCLMLPPCCRGFGVPRACCRLLRQRHDAKTITMPLHGGPVKPGPARPGHRRNFNQQKVAPRTNIMVEEFKRRGARGAGKKLPVGGGGRKAGTANPDGVLRESEEEAAEAAAAAAVRILGTHTLSKLLRLGVGTGSSPSGQRCCPFLAAGRWKQELPRKQQVSSPGLLAGCCSTVHTSWVQQWLHQPPPQERLQSHWSDRRQHVG